MKQLLSLIVIAFLPLAVANAQIYKYVDENGIINYSSEKPGNYRYKTLTFPCYVGDASCRKIDWEEIPLNYQAFATIIEQAAQSYSVDQALVRAIIHAESAFQPDAKSPRGAQGLMQLIPANQPRYGISDPYHPGQNIYGGTQHLAELLEEFEGDVERALAAYNAGAGAVRKYDGIPPYEETQEYVRRVKILHRRYAGG